MLFNQKVEVFFSSKTIGGFKGRKGLQLVCHSCDKALGVKREDSKLVTLVPPEAMPLIFSAQRAAQELGITLELVDINQLSVFQRLKFRLQGRPLPYVKIGEEFIFGTPTKDEIIECYVNAVGNN